MRLNFHKIWTVLNVMAAAIVAYDIPPSYPERRPLLVISLDGFSHTFMNRFQLPGLTNIAKAGVYITDGMKPVYVTKSAPNHQTISTGVLPDKHGIFDDDMYDPVYKEYFNPGSTDPKWYYREPIWIQAMKQGLRTRLLDWPSGKVNYDSALQGYYSENNIHDINYFENQLYSANKALQNGTDLVMMFFREPAQTARTYGTTSTEFQDMLKRIDQAIQKWFEEYKELAFPNTTNLFIISGNGIKDVNNSYLVDLNKIFLFPASEAGVIVPKTAPAIGIWPQSLNVQMVFQRLEEVSQATAALTRFHVKSREMLLEKVNYLQQSRRIPRYIVIGENDTILTFGENVSEVKACVADPLVTGTTFIYQGVLPGMSDL